MSSATVYPPTRNKELQHLKHEVSLLRSFMISIIGEDKEGQYRPEFIKEILKASQEKPEYVFKDARSFLAQLTELKRL